MMSEPLTSPTFSEAESHQGPTDYRPLSAMAICAAVLALLSPVALASPVFWAIPLLAVIVSFIAVQSIIQNEQQLAGKRLAILSLVWSSIFLVAGPSQFISRRWMVTRQARNVAEQWLQHVSKGELMRAHQLTYDSFRRTEGADSELAEFYEKNAEDGQSLERFEQSELVQRLLESGSAVTWEFDSRTLHEQDRTKDHVGVRYLIKYATNAGDGQPFFADLLLVRHRNHFTRQGEWVVEDYTLTPIYPTVGG